VILTSRFSLAREDDSQYDRAMKKMEAGKDGLEPAVVAAVWDRKLTPGLTEKDASPIDFGRELFSKHVVAATSYARVVKVFGKRDLVDLVAVMSQHASEATILAAFDQHPPVGQPHRWERFIGPRTNSPNHDGSKG
jgi:hypothetical protein